MNGEAWCYEREATGKPEGCEALQQATAAVRFAGFTDSELDDLAMALDAAAGEGAFGNQAMVRELAAAFERRGRAIPLPWSHGERSPGQWIVDMENR